MSHHFTRLALLAPAALALAACSQEAEEPMAEPVTAGPADAPGVPQEELDTRQAVSDLGIAARAIQQANDLESARDALGTFEQQLTDGAENLPAGLADRLEVHLDTARDAIGTDNLAGVHTAAQEMINTVLGSETIQDPTLVEPAAAE